MPPASSSPVMTFLRTPFGPRFRRWNYLLIALAVIAVTGIASMIDEKGRSSIDLSMNGSRVVYGLTVATSNYQFGSPLYSFYLPVFDTFYTKQTLSWGAVNNLIDNARAIDPKTLSPDTLHIGFGELDEDDKGIIVWYRAAFSLFGPSLEAVYLLYFLMLASSVWIFWLSFRDDEPALILMTLYALVQLSLSAYALSGNTNVIGSLLGTRPFAMLAALPSLHLALLMVRKRLPSPWLIAGVAAQIVFLLLITEVRSSAKIQFLFIFLVAAWMLALWLVRGEPGRFREWRQKWFKRTVFRPAFVWVSVCLLIGIAGVNIAYSAAIPADLRARAASNHLVWYAGLGGFVLNPEMSNELLEFAKVYKPKNTNNGIYNADGTVKESPSADALARWSVIGFAKNIRGEEITDYIVGGPDKRNANLYERYARMLFFYELGHRPVDMVTLYAFNKTRNLLAMLRNVLFHLYLGDILVIAFVLGLLGGAAWLRGLRVMAPLLVTGFAVSSIPAYWFVPATHVMYDYAPYFYLCFLGIAACAGALCASLIARRMDRIRPVLHTVFPVLAIAALPLAVVGILIVERFPSDREQSNIIVVSATYGGNVGGSHGNVTAPVRQFCNGLQKCAYRVDVGVLGDPAGGKEKDFVVEYQCSHVLKPLKQSIPAEAHKKTIVLDCTP